jgi:hypothetical protein
MEIWSVNAADEPSAALAGATIANVPATIPPGPRTLTGFFATPATVVAGIRYALVISGRIGQNSNIYGLPTDECPDGIWFYATTPNGGSRHSPGVISASPPSSQPNRAWCPASRELIGASSVSRYDPGEARSRVQSRSSAADECRVTGLYIYAPCAERPRWRLTWTSDDTDVDAA